MDKILMKHFAQSVVNFISDLVVLCNLTQKYVNHTRDVMVQIDRCCKNITLDFYSPKANNLD